MLFTFPSRYLFTIDLQTFLALEDGPPRFKPDYTCPTLLRNTLELHPIFADGTITLYGVTFQTLWLIEMLFMLRSYNPVPRKVRFGLLPFRSPLLRESRLIYFPRLLRCFSSPSFLDMAMFLPYRTTTLLAVGSPIGKSPGQSLLNGSPKLIAVSYVLHRSLESRHPLYAFK